jgi:hypothetical protein
MFPVRFYPNYASSWLIGNETLGIIKQKWSFASYFGDEVLETATSFHIFKPMVPVEMPRMWACMASNVHIWRFGTNSKLLISANLAG